MAMVDVDGSSIPVDSQPKLIGLVRGLAATWRSVSILQVNGVNSRNGCGTDDSIVASVMLHASHRARPAAAVRYRTLVN